MTTCEWAGCNQICDVTGPPWGISKGFLTLGALKIGYLLGNLEIQYPTWYVIICLLVGLSVAFLLYYRSKHFPTDNPIVKAGLGFLRFASVTLLCLLLLSPILKTSNQETRNPIIVFAQDQSMSVQAEMDSNVLRTYQTQMQQVIDALGDDYDVKTFAFGEEIRDGIDFDFSDRSSNHSAVLEHIGDLYGDQNLGAVVYASDGIFNEGKDPLYANLGFSAPIYTVALGDTTPDKDLYIRQVFSNNIAYLGDRTSIQVDVSAFNCLNHNAVLRVHKVNADGNVLLRSEPLRVDQDDFFRTVELDIPQENVGLQRYRVSVSTVPGEKSTSNNRKDFFIDVIDARQKILILAASPHPDIAAIKSTLDKNKNYEVTSEVIRGYQGDVGEYDFIVLHQLPARGLNAVRTLRQINELEIPRLIIVGNLTNISALNQFQSLVSIELKGGNANVVQGIINRGFSPFTSTDELANTIGEFAPIDAPFADYAVDPSTDVLLYQRIGKVDTDFPLWIIGEQQGIKSGVICGEGLWRWKLYDYLQNEENVLFDELISNTIQYLTLREDKRKFRVFQVKNLLAENEDALFDAELYNQSYQLVNEPGVTMAIRNGKGEVFNFGFSKLNKAYSLNAGRLPVDDYTWTATTQYEGERYTANGQFSVQAIEKESYATVANHNLLAQISTNTNAQVFAPDEVNEITEVIRNQAGLKPIYYQVMKVRNAIHLKWIFFALVLLLALEWGLRRYLGAY